MTLEKTTAGALTYYEWQADGALATKHDADGWTYFTWDVDDSLTQIERPVGRDGFMRLTNEYDADMKRVSMGYGQGGDLPTLGYWNDFLYDGEKVAARRYGGVFGVAPTRPGCARTAH